MLIDKKRLLRNHTLKVAYPLNIEELDKQEVYKEWFSFSMIGINKYVELLHKQLIRKARAQRKNIFHPLYPKAYIVEKYNIKSPSRSAYNKHNANDLGLNQFFVGQDPFKPYKGDPSSKNGIYHDICEIRTKYSLKSMPYYYGFPDIALLFNKKDALKYKRKGFYYIDNEINFKKILTQALKDIQYHRLINNADFCVFMQIFKKNNEWVYPNINDIRIPKAQTQIVNFNTTFGISTKQICVDIQKFCNDFNRLNQNICKILKTDIYFKTYTRTSRDDPYELKYEKINFLNAFENIKKIYICKYATPLCFYKSFYQVCYKEPYVAFGILDNRIWFRKNTNITPIVYPLYRRNSHLPYGRRDRWFALWDEFYYLYVYEKKSKGILSFLMPIVSIALAVATWWIGGQGAWLSAMLGISSKSAMILSLSITLSLSFGALSGNQFFSTLNSIWGLINFIGGFGANDWNLTADFTKTTVQAAQEMTSFEAGLNSLINIFSGVNKVFDVVKNITADTPKMINNNSNNQINDDKITNASAAQELAKDAINPTLWYNFETADILNEKIEKKEKPIFIF